MKVFISYSHYDKDKALIIKSILQEIGLKVLIDEQIDPGDSITKWISDTFQKADIILPLLSKAYLNSRYCDRELFAGIDRWVASSGAIRFLIVLLEECSIPTIIADLKYVNAKNIDDKIGIKKNLINLLTLSSNHNSDHLAQNLR